MSFNGVRGLDAAQSMFNALPDAARYELAVALGEIAKIILRAQQTAVAVGTTGDLKAGLTVEIQVALLRVKVGLVNLKRGSHPLFYGRFVDQGVRAQTVLVERRRRVNGRLRLERRGNRKRLSDIVARYSLNVRAQPARPFIDPPGADLDGQIATVLEDFWSNTFSRVGAAA